MIYMGNNLYLDLAELDPTCDYPHVIITDSYRWDELNYLMKDNIEEYGHRGIHYHTYVSFPSTASIMGILNRFYSGSLVDIHNHLVKEFDLSSKQYNIMIIIAFKKPESAVLFKLKDLS